MAPGNLRQAAAGLAGALAGTLGVRFSRDLPWGLSAIVGLSIGVLVVSALRSSEQVRALWRSRRDASGPE